jgi:hypothetical protein
LYGLLGAVVKAEVWQTEGVREILPAFSFQHPKDQGEQVLA